MNIYVNPSWLKGVKSEFGFDTDATESRTKAKRMFELLNPLSHKGFYLMQ